MDKSFGKDYIIEFEQNFENEFNTDETMAKAASDIALGHLRNILIILNGGLLVVVPLAAWYLTRRTLYPVQNIHNQQKQFVSDVAHELRTPLSILSGELEIALKQPPDINEYQQTLASSKQETDRMAKLVENLLFLAREDQRRVKPPFEKIDLTDLLGSVISSLQVESRKKEIRVSFQPESEPTFVWGEPSMLRRLFLNIIENAIQYTPNTGNVRISLASHKQCVEIQVKDTGIGISEEDQKKLFHRFFRADPSRSLTRGYGLGLAISQSIANLHRGKIDVHSSLGQGSTFTIIFPSVRA